MTEELYRIDTDEDMLLELQGFLDNLTSMRILPDKIQAEMNDFVTQLGDRNRCPYTLQQYAKEAIGCEVKSVHDLLVKDIELDSDKGIEIAKILEAGNVLMTVDSDDALVNACLRTVKDALR